MQPLATLCLAEARVGGDWVWHQGHTVTPAGSAEPFVEEVIHEVQAFDARCAQIGAIEKVAKPVGQPWTDGSRSEVDPQLARNSARHRTEAREPEEGHRRHLCVTARYQNVVGREVPHDPAQVAMYAEPLPHRHAWIRVRQHRFDSYGVFERRKKVREFGRASPRLGDRDDDLVDQGNQRRKQLRQVLVVMAEMKLLIDQHSHQRLSASRPEPK